MEKLGQKSQPHNRYNEDFIYTAHVTSTDLLMVGDFAESEYVGIDGAATDELKQLLGDPGIIKAASISVPLLLTQLAGQFNGRLLNLQESFKASFQSSVVFGATNGATLYYLAIGDCRIAISRQGSLILLNSSLWVDPITRQVPNVITSGKEMVRGSEPPPDQALGVSAKMAFSIDQVQDFSLERDDLVLLYSDGLDKFVSPAQILAIIEDRSSNESTQELVERILEAVKFQNGNDDRTLLIAGGPFVGAEDSGKQARKETQDAEARLNANIDQVSARVESLGSNLNNLISVQKGIETLETPVSEILGKLDKVMKLQQANPSAAATPTLVESTLSRIEHALEGLKGEIGSLKKRLPASPDGKAVSEESAQKRGAAKDTSKVVAPSIQKEEIAGSADPPSPLLNRVSDDLPVREGVILVREGSYELVDQSYAFRPDRPFTGPEIYLAQTESAPAGWLTAFYLYLRTLEQPSGVGYVNDIEAWMFANLKSGSEAIGKLKGSELRSLRYGHWGWRSDRNKFPIFGLSREQLIKKETELANKSFRTGAVLVVVKNDKPGLIAAALGQLKTFWGIIIVLAFIGLVVLFGFLLVLPYLNSSPRIAQPVQNGPTATADQTKLEYGADGRTLRAVSGNKTDTLKYRIAYGKEKEFRDQIGTPILGSVQELEKKIEKEAAALVWANNQPELLPDTLLMRNVELDDLRVNGRERCERFLTRINQPLPKNVHNVLENLTQLNPGLRCGELSAGDQLVVIGKVAAAGRRQRSR